MKDIFVKLDHGIICGMYHVIDEYEKKGLELVVQTGNKIHRLTVKQAKEIMRRLNCSCLS